MAVNASAETRVKQALAASLQTARARGSTLLELSAGVLPVGHSVTTHVTLCNALEGCASQSHVVVVRSEAVPLVSILGPRERSVFQSVEALFTARVQRADASCSTVDGSSPSSSGVGAGADLSIVWEVSKDGLIDPSLGSNGLGSGSDGGDPRRLRIVTDALAPGALYSVRVLVTDKLTFRSAADTVSVRVASRGLVVNVAGSSRRILPLGSSLVLDADSNSWDDDLGRSVVVGEAAGLEFLWSCVTIAPNFTTSCPLLYWNQRRHFSVHKRRVALETSMPELTAPSSANFVGLVRVYECFFVSACAIGFM